MGGDSEPCGTCAAHLFQMAETQICAFKRAKMSSTRGSVHIIWPGIIRRAERETGCKLKGSLRLIAGLLLINTFFFSPIPGFEAG